MGTTRGPIAGVINNLFLRNLTKEDVGIKKEARDKVIALATMSRIVQSQDQYHLMDHVRIVAIFTKALASCKLVA